MPACLNPGARVVVAIQPARRSAYSAPSGLGTNFSFVPGATLRLPLAVLYRAFGAGAEQKNCCDAPFGAEQRRRAMNMAAGMQGEEQRTAPKARNRVARGKREARRPWTASAQGYKP